MFTKVSSDRIMAAYQLRVVACREHHSLIPWRLSH